MDATSLHSMHVDVKGFIHDYLLAIGCWRLKRCNRRRSASPTSGQPYQHLSRHVLYVSFNVGYRALAPPHSVQIADQSL